jgi:hypothetical protein
MKKARAEGKKCHAKTMFLVYLQANKAREGESRFQIFLFFSLCASDFTACRRSSKSNAKNEV